MAVKEDGTLIRTKAERNAQYLSVLRILSACGESYTYLMDLQEEKVWLFGGFDADFDLGEKQPDGSYLFSQLLGSLHPQDRPSLAADMAQLIQGAKMGHDLNYRVLSRSGGYVWFNCRGEVELDDGGRPSVMMGRISGAASRHLFDTLTGLYNQEQLLQDLEHALSERKKGVLVFLGIDNMKNINTMHGRLEGDRILQDMAKYLKEMEADTPIYRMSGDVFALIKFDTDEDELQDSFHRLQERVSDRFTISGGAVPMDAPGMDVSVLIQYCEFAMREAKKTGKDKLAIFDMRMYQSEELSVSLLNEMAESVKRGCEGFSLAYQAQVMSNHYELFGAEALLRFKSHARGDVFPDEFIPLLERSGLIYPVGLWVLNTALTQCRAWRKYVPDFHISINMSYMQLSKPEIVQDVLDALDRSGLPGEALTIEVTESMQLQEYRYYNTIFKVWQERGISISVDDFGTGFSSLSYLKFLNVDEIKIDRCFVSGIHANNYNFMLLKNIVQLSDSAQIRICCEGVEEPEDYHVLSRLHLMLLQGYLFSRPCGSEAFERQFFLEDDPEYRQYLGILSRSDDKQSAEFLELHHQNILRSVSMGLWLIRFTDNGVGAEMYADETMRELLGIREPLTPAECYRFWFDRISPEDRPRVEEVLRHVFETGEVTRTQYAWDHPERGAIQAGGSGARLNLSSAENCLQGCHWIVDDTLDHTGGAEPVRLAELDARCRALAAENKHLKEMDLIYRTALSLTDHVVSYIDIPNRNLHHIYLETTYDGVGGVMENVPDAVLNTGIIPPEDQATFRQFYDDVYSGKPDGKSGLFRTAEGDRRGWVQMMFKTLFDDEGNPSKAVCFSDDVTERVNAERRYDEYRRAVVSGADSFWEANLTQNALIAEDSVFDDELLGRSGFKRYTDIISAALASVERDYRETVSTHFSVESLFRAYSCGKREFSLEYPMRSAQGKPVWLRTTVYLLSNAQSELCAIICSNNITEEKNFLLLTREQALHDPLTTLLNRRGIAEAVSRKLVEKHGGWEGIFLVADVDNFKEINDNWGHPVGDIVLQRIAGTLLECFRNGDLVSRLGGDEFAILIDGKMDTSLLESRLLDMQRMLRGVSLPNGCFLDVHLSVGATRVRANDKFEDMYHRADLCMYDVKKHGKNSFNVS